MSQERVCVLYFDEKNTHHPNMNSMARSHASLSSGMIAHIRHKVSHIGC